MCVYLEVVAAVLKGVGNFAYKNNPDVTCSKINFIVGEEASKKDESDVDYFRNLVTTETERLNQSIEKWNKILLGGNSHCPAEGWLMTFQLFMCVVFVTTLYCTFKY